MQYVRLFVFFWLAVLILVSAWYFPKQWRESAREADRERKEEELRAKVSFQSLEDRIPKRKGIRQSNASTEATPDRWETLAVQIHEKQAQRSDLLKALHERTTKFFVESPGNGPNRTVAGTSNEEVVLGESPTFGAIMHPPPQPGRPADVAVSPADAGAPD